MKNTFANQINQKQLKFENLCTITFSGETLILSDQEKQSFGLLIERTMQRFIHFVVRVVKAFSVIGFRKGKSTMKDIRTYANSEKVNDLCPECPAYVSPYTNWESNYKQKNL